MKYRYVLALLVATGLASLATAQDRNDRVTFVSDRTKNPPVNTTRSGTVTTEDPGKLVVLVGSAKTPHDIKVGDVVEVRYDGEPDEATQGRTAERRRDYDKALSAYREAAKKTPATNKFLKTHLEFAVARMLAQQAENGQTEARGPAIEALRKFKADNGTSRQIVDALDILSRLLVQDGKSTQEVVDAFRQLRAQYTDNKDVAARCNLFESQILLQDAQILLKDNPEEAKKKYQDVQTQLQAAVQANDKSVSPELRIALAECKAVLGNLPDALKDFDTLFKEVSEEDKPTRASLHLGRADCYRLNKQYRDAMWDYLKVDVLYAQDRDQQAKALYHLQEVFEALKEADGNAATRAKECRDRLLTDPRLKDTRYQKLAGK